MAAKGFIFDLKGAGSGKKTVATGQGVLRAIAIQIVSDTNRSNVFADFGTAGLKLYIDGEGTASTDLYFRELFGGVAEDNPTSSADWHMVAAGSWDGQDQQISFNRMHSCFMPVWTPAASAEYWGYGERNVRIPFDTSLEAEMIDDTAINVATLEVALF